MVFSNIPALVVLICILSTVRSQSTPVSISWETRFQVLQIQLTSQALANSQRLNNLEKLVKTKLESGKAISPSGGMNKDVEEQLKEMKKSITDFETHIETIVKRLEDGVATEKVFRQLNGKTCESTKKTLNDFIDQYKKDKASDNGGLSAQLIEALGKLNDTFTEFRKDIQAQIEDIEIAEKKPKKGCPSGWFQIDNDCFLFVEDAERPWYLAAMVCQKLDAKLAEPKTAAVNEKLIDKVGDQSAWLGGTDEETEGVWKWSSTNEAVSYTKWAKRQPNSSGGDQDCLQIWKKAWNDLSCSTAGNYICEKKIAN